MNKPESHFLSFLKSQRGLSENTVIAYRRDIDAFQAFIGSKGKTLADVDIPLIRKYLTYELYERKTSKRTMARRLVSLRAFYTFLCDQYNEEFLQNPFLFITSPKQDITFPTALFQNEINKLLEENAKRTDDLMPRDQAILELLYASGMRMAKAGRTARSFSTNWPKKR